MQANEGDTCQNAYFKNIFLIGLHKYCERRKHNRHDAVRHTGSFAAAETSYQACQGDRTDRHDNCQWPVKCDTSSV